MATVDGLTEGERNGAMVRMRKAMQRQGHTYKTLAEAMTEAGAAVSQKTVRRWMQPTNTSAPNVRQIHLICRMLDLNPTYFLYGIGAERLSTVKKLHNFAGAAAEMVEAAARIKSVADALESTSPVPVKD